MDLGNDTPTPDFSEDVIRPQNTEDRHSTSLYSMINMTSVLDKDYGICRFGLRIASDNGTHAYVYSGSVLFKQTAISQQPTEYGLENPAKYAESNQPAGESGAVRRAGSVGMGLLIAAVLVSVQIL